jgi:hypothetical protein
MALSYTETNGDGATTNFAVPFSYLDKTHVHAYVDDVEKTFTWVNSATIQLSPAPPVGVLNVVIKRITPRFEVLVDYNNGSVLFDTDLDIAYLQCLFILQEQNEQAETLFPAGHTLDSHSDATPGASTAKGTVRVYDVNGKQISLLVGADGQVLEADSATASGLGWKQGLRKLITAAGDLLYGTANGVAARLGIGTEGQVLTVSAGGLPVWQNPALGSGGGGNSSAADIIDNGCMEVWQRGAGAKTTVGGSWLADRFKFFSNTATMAYTSQRSANVPTVAQAGIALNYSAEIKCDTIEAGYSAAESSLIHHTVEGYRWINFAQRVFTLSFWVYSTKTGTFCVSFRNNGFDRSYVAEYTINASNTWEFKTIVVPASPTAGSWNYLDDRGIVISWALGAGSNFFTTAGAWQTGNFISTSNQVNFFDNTSNYFRITGVKTDLGINATQLSPLPFPEELQRCKRYFFKTFRYDITPAQAVGNAKGEYTAYATRAGNVDNFGMRQYFAVPLRTQPTVTTYNPLNANSFGVDILTLQNLVVGASFDREGYIISMTGHTTTSIGSALMVNFTCDADWA